MDKKPKIKRYSRKQIKKLCDGKCLVCSENKYELLDAHRIIEQGTYYSINVVTLCSKCHRLTHCGDIKFDKKYRTTTGKLLLHWWFNGEEKWTPVAS